MWLCINTRSEGWTGHLSDGFAPPLMHSKKKLCWSDSKKLCWSDAKRLQSSSTHQNTAKTLSDAFFGMARRRDDVSSVRFLNRPANKKKWNSYENTQRMATNWSSLLWIDAVLQIWSSQNIQHIQIVVKLHSRFDKLFCFLIWKHFVDLSEHEWNHRVRLLCELLESMFLPFAP